MSGFTARLAEAPVRVGAAESELVRSAMLDTFAAITAGAQEAVVQRLRAAQDACGTTGAAAQAMLLGTAAHAQDFDDYETLSLTHPSATLVPVVMAVPELSMADATRAYVAGFETILALGQALGQAHYLAGWHATSTIGAIGAARTAAIALRLTTDQTKQALGIATSRAAGLKVQFGSDVKPLHAGFAASAGLEAAFLAGAGIRAKEDAFCAAGGLLEVYGAAKPPPDTVCLPRIAEHPPFTKPWPSCAYTHRAIEAALQLAGPPPDEIRLVELAMAEPYAEVCALRSPKTTEAARFSAAFCVAATLVDHALGPKSFAAEALRRPEIAGLESRVDHLRYPLPDGAGDMSPLAPDRIALYLRDGEVRRAEVANVAGGPAKPLDADAILRKFVDCGGAAGPGAAFLAANGTDPFVPPVPDIVLKGSV